jgi:polar amino acid transport system substrate-binding protein
MTLVTEGKLTIATSPDYPPFENLENGEYVGLDIEIAKAVAAELGLEPEFKTLQFDAIIPAIAAGGQADMGISGFSVDPERAKEIDFSSSYYIDDQAIAVMKGGEITADNADEALNAEGVKIAVQSGTTGEAYVQENFPNATAQPYGNSTDAFAAMQSGQAVAVCTNKAVVDKMLADAYQDAEVVKSIATGEEYAIVVSKDNPALTEAINAALAKLQGDGTIDQLIGQFM